MDRTDLRKAKSVTQGIRISLESKVQRKTDVAKRIVKDCCVRMAHGIYEYISVAAELSYSVFPRLDAIVRNVRIVNSNDQYRDISKSHLQ